MKITYYTFQGSNGIITEGLKIAISESRETIWLCSSKTDFKFVDVSDKFFDTPEEKTKVIAMSQDEFDATIIKTFVAQGYGFVKKQVDEG